MGITGPSRSKKEATAELALANQSFEEEKPIVILATGEIEAHGDEVFGPHQRSLALTDQRGEYVGPSALLGRDDVADLRSKGRWFVEQEKLKSHFPQFQLLGRGGPPTKCSGRLRDNWGGVHDVHILLAGYPACLPDVHVPGLGRNPHMFGSPEAHPEGAKICYMKRDLWNPNQTTLAFVVGKVAIYLNKAAIYERQGIWPGSDEHAR